MLLVVWEGCLVPKVTNERRSCSNETKTILKETSANLPTVLLVGEEGRGDNKGRPWREESTKDKLLQTPFLLKLVS